MEIRDWFKKIEPPNKVTAREPMTADRMAGIVAGIAGKRQRYRGLAADNGRSNGARR